jgi:hypothetical protein
VRSPNVIVLGGISYAKSTLIKTCIYRQYLFGRQAWVIDLAVETNAGARSPIRQSREPFSRPGARNVADRAEFGPRFSLVTATKAFTSSFSDYVEANRLFCRLA